MLHISKLYVQFLEGVSAMSITFRHLIPLATGAAAVAIAVAPIASAADDPHLVCTYQAPGNSQCDTPGNAQIDAAPQAVPYESLYPVVLGDILVHHLPSVGVGGLR